MKTFRKSRNSFPSAQTPRCRFLPHGLVIDTTLFGSLIWTRSRTHISFPRKPNFYWQGTTPRRRAQRIKSDKSTMRTGTEHPLVDLSLLLRLIQVFAGREILIAAEMLGP